MTKKLESITIESEDKLDEALKGVTHCKVDDTWKKVDEGALPTFSELLGTGSPAEARFEIMSKFQKLIEKAPGEKVVIIGTNPKIQCPEAQDGAKITATLRFALLSA